MSINGVEGKKRKTFHGMYVAVRNASIWQNSKEYYPSRETGGKKGTKIPSKANQTSLAKDNVWEAPFFKKAVF